MERLLSTVQVRWGVRVPLRDGVALAADVFLPEDAGPARRVPAIVVRTPYGRGTDRLVDQARYFAARGYAVVNVDVRGRGDSDGVFVPYRNEGRDGYDTIEWAAAQPWCSGAVGTLGASYLARVQWLAALEHPPHLKAMVSLVTPSDPFVEWPTGTPGPMHLCWLFMTSDRQVQNIRAVEWERVYRHLPLRTMDEAAGRLIPAWREECDHPQLDDWWREIAYQDRFAEIDLPVLHISGWYDDEQVGTPKNFAGMVRHAPSERARRGQRLIMGPWPHQVNESTRMGAVDFGPQSLIDLRAEELRFFDRWLKGEPRELDDEPPVRIFVMGTCRWRDEWTWPPAGVQWTRWYLHSGGRANSLFGDGTLSPEPPGEDEPADRYTYDPDHPVPFITEPWSTQIGGPDDYRPVHRRDDVLVYTSEPLAEPLEVTGPV
ncbi:MAG: CocE/NonD family hydrolase, partial [Alicyclobacillus sp.]|nr:CocE/NonD family hydrolase [Alicyclobacillus sp.]